MRTLGMITATLGVVGAIAAGSAVPAAADWYGRHYHGYYNYYGGASGPNNPCPMGYTVQGGRCQPYHHGPWDYYGPRYGYWR